MTDFLQLPHLKTLSFQDKGHYYHVFATGTITPSGCPSCASDIYRHGKEPQKYVDSPVRGNPVIIEIERQRFRCKACGKAFYESLPDMHDKRLTTKRLVHYVESRALNQTFASLSNEVGLDEKSVKNIFSDHVKTLKHEVQYETPSILGIDEVKCSGEFRCILTNIEECSAFEFLDSLNEDKLGQFFETLPNKKQISTVVMDTSNHFKRVVQQYLPGRLIVADRFHVTKMANDAFERIRRKVWQHLDLESKSAFNSYRHKLKLRKKSLLPEESLILDNYMSGIPELKLAYDAKESFCSLYELPSRKHAEAAAADWILNLAPSIAVAFKPCKSVLEKWHDEIFNYYEYKVTNAYTESLNRIIKDITRAGRGYDFEVIRAKLLYNQRARTLTQKSIRRKVASEESCWGLVGLSNGKSLAEPVHFVNQTIEYGPSLSLLSEEISKKNLW